MTGTVVICDVDGVLTDGRVYVDSNGVESLVFSKKDGWLLAEARAAGIEVVMVTDDPNPYPAEARARKLGVSLIGSARGGSRYLCVTQTCTAVLGAVQLSELTKVRVVSELKGAGYRTVYIGDSPADLEAMRAADVALCPVDARSLSTDDLDGKLHRLYAPGGHGVLHEALTRLMAGEFGEVGK